MFARRRRFRHERRQRRIAETISDGDEKCHGVEQRHLIDRRNRRETDRVRDRADRDESLLTESFREPADQSALYRRHDHAHEEKEPSEVSLAEMKTLDGVERDARLHSGDRQQREKQRGDHGEEHKADSKHCSTSRHAAAACHRFHLTGRRLFV